MRMPIIKALLHRKTTRAIKELLCTLPSAETALSTIYERNGRLGATSALGEAPCLSKTPNSR